MAKPKQSRSSLWARITDTASAEAAVKSASNAAWLVAAVTGVVSGVALVRGPVLGIDGSGMVDAVLMAVAGWRLTRHSRAWSIVALLDWLVSLYAKLTNGSPAMTGAILASIAMLFLFIGGVRGTFALARFRKASLAVVPAA